MILRYRQYPVRALVTRPANCIAVRMPMRIVQSLCLAIAKIPPNSGPNHAHLRSTIQARSHKEPDDPKKRDRQHHQESTQGNEPRVLCAHGGLKQRDDERQRGQTSSRHQVLKQSQQVDP
jgi:hypothetical protein